LKEKEVEKNKKELGKEIDKNCTKDTQRLLASLFPHLPFVPVNIALCFAWLETLSSRSR
jgi:hypothetical protein